MKVMVIVVKATKESEAGMMPDEGHRRDGQVQRGAVPAAPARLRCAGPGASAWGSGSARAVVLTALSMILPGTTRASDS